VPRVASVNRKKLAKKAIPLAQHSSSFVATQIELPVVDITCDYDSCRYNTFEQSLRKRYGANYPPGDVVLHYIQLNTADSCNKIDGNVSGHLLDPFEENDSNTYSSVSTKLEAEYLSLLDHFIWKQRERVLTTNKFTEIPSPDDRNLEASSHAGASSQSTLGSFLTQEKESVCSGNQRSLKGTEYAQFRCFSVRATGWGLANDFYRDIFDS